MKHSKTPKRLLGDIDATTASHLVTVAADVALVLDRRGVIKDLAYEDEDLRNEDFGDWVGQPWIDTVTVESRPKIEDLLKPRPSGSAAIWRQVTHKMHAGPGLPVKYLTVPFGTEGRLVAMGRNLRSFAALQQRLLEAQREAEREITEIQSTETRYRALFQLSSEAIVVADAGSQKVVEANPAAIARLGKSNGTRRIVGRPLAELFSPVSATDVQNLIGAARAALKAGGIVVRLVGSEREVDLAVSLFRQDGSSLLLARITECQDRRAATSGLPSDRTLAEVVERLPDGFVMIDRMRRVLAANTAFLQLVQLGTDEQVRGQSVDRWLGRVDIDVDILMTNLREHGSLRNFGTIVRGEYGLSQDIVISGVAVNSGADACYGLTIRRVERAGATASSGTSITRSVEQLTALIGRTPLKDIVRETTDLIEKLCIEAALKLTNDNRASAAEVLGLSRQSLYIKLRRYGLGELDSQS